MREEDKEGNIEEENFKFLRRIEEKKKKENNEESKLMRGGIEEIIVKEMILMMIEIERKKEVMIKEMKEKILGNKNGEIVGND